MKVKKMIATLLAAVTLVVPFNCVTASAEGFDPTSKDSINNRFFSVTNSYNFQASVGYPDTTSTFSWDGSTSIYATFDRTTYGTARVELHRVGYGYTGTYFNIDSDPKPSQYVYLDFNFGPGTYYFIITTTTSTKGYFAIGHY